MDGFPHGNGDGHPGADGESVLASQEMYLFVYRSCLLDQLHVLDHDIYQLESTTSYSGLLNEILNLTHDGSPGPGTGLTEEISRARANRERIYTELVRTQQKLKDIHAQRAANAVGSPPSASSAA